VAQDLPSSARTILLQRRREFQAREFSFKAKLDDEFERPFEMFQKELDRYFAQFFILPFPDLSPEETPAWNTVQAASLGTVDALTQQFQDEIMDAADDALEEFDDTLAGAYAAGYEQGLWALFLGGVDGALDEEPIDEEDALEALLAAQINGLDYRDRVGAWAGVATQKVNGALRYAVATEQPFPETLSRLGGIAATVKAGLAGLGSNELFWALALGAAAAYNRFDEAEVWVTMDDEKVCPICWPKHLTVTTDQPIRDSHPNCRCEKLPQSMVQGRARTYVPYSVFQARRTG